MNAWAKMDALMAKSTEPKGTEWFTVAQFAARYSLTESAAGMRLRRMHKAKRVEKWIGPVNGKQTSKYRLAA